MSDIVLSAREVTKIYPGTTALDRVNFDIERGQVHVLIGENGAGKSTLMKILAGVEQPTSGRLYRNRQETVFKSARDATRQGIGMIHQELNLCPNLSVMDNIFLGYEETAGPLLDLRKQRQVAREIMMRLEHPIDPDAIAGELPLGHQQIVEIAKALARSAQVLIMDEPTSALSSTEITVLFRVIRELKAQGVSFVYVSHRLEELLAVGDSITVLRDGRAVAGAPAGDVTTAWIVEKMTGRTASESAAAVAPTGTEELLKISQLSLEQSRGRFLLKDVDLQLRAGEILGLYGLLGAGRTELLETLIGLRRQTRGTIELAGREIQNLSLEERLRAGFALVPEDRQAAGLIPDLSVQQNITLASLGQYSTAGYLSPDKEEEAARKAVTEFRIKTGSLGQLIRSLSGGNQQKALIARALLTKPKVLLLDEPTRGVDVGARAEIYSVIRDVAASGVGVVFTSSDLQELRLLAQRIVVLSRGRVSGDVSTDAASDEVLLVALSFFAESAA